MQPDTSAPVTTQQSTLGQSRRARPGVAQADDAVALQFASFQDALVAARSNPEFDGLQRSIDVYYGDADRHRAMDLIYAPFLRPGDLAFDIGSHVGDRTASFRRLGARVVALEPQPACRGLIAKLFFNDADVSIGAELVGAAEGSVPFHVNSANPTVSTAAPAFIEAADDADGWREQVWDTRFNADVTTLDALIAEHGKPQFIKIDVEGYEAEVLQGLTQAVPALSFEFTTIQRDVAHACIARLAELARYEFNLAIGESQALAGADWIDTAAISERIDALPAEANSGDIYARLGDAQ